MKALIIEDTKEVIESTFLTFQLRWPGATLISTDSGEKGVELVETESPDIVILDIGLPDMSGFDVLRQIRRFSSVPVIILTGHAKIARRVNEGGFNLLDGGIRIILP